MEMEIDTDKQQTVGKAESVAAEFFIDRRGVYGRDSSPTPGGGKVRRGSGRRRRNGCLPALPTQAVTYHCVWSE